MMPTTPRSAVSIRLMVVIIRAQAVKESLPTLARTIGVAMSCTPSGAIRLIATRAASRRYVPAPATAAPAASAVTRAPGALAVVGAAGPPVPYPAGHPGKPGATRGFEEGDGDSDIAEQGHGGGNPRRFPAPVLPGKDHRVAGGPVQPPGRVLGGPQTQRPAPPPGVTEAVREMHGPVLDHPPAGPAGPEAEVLVDAVDEEVLAEGSDGVQHGAADQHPRRDHDRQVRDDRSSRTCRS